MLAAERHTRIVDEVRRRGAVRVAELAQQLAVSDMTIRRDLDDLAGQGVVDKVHGGAVLRQLQPPSADEPGFAAKSVRQMAEKRAIARAAAELVPAGAAIGLSAGTTTWVLAQELRDIDGLTVVTNSLRVADVLHASPRQDREVVLTGGVRTPSDALVGPLAVSALGQLHLDLVFLGVHGMTEAAGFTTPNLLEAEANRALVSAGRRLVVLADHTKWGTVGMSTIFPLSAAELLITDERLPDDARATLGEHIPAVRVAVSGQL